MRILMVHNRYLQSGGEDQSFRGRMQLLRAHGHEVQALVEDNARVAELGGLRTAVRTVWSHEAYTRLERLLRERRYDLIDVHNTFPLLSPAIYYAARAQRVKVVQTLHNYRLLCSKATFFRDRRVCEDCLGKAVPWPGIVHGCYRASRAGTAVVVAMLSAHRLVRTWTRAVDTYIAVSEFARAKFIQGGLPAQKIVVARNFVDPDPGVGGHSGNYALFVGRLAAEKGIETLLSAWERLEHALPLRIVGDGPLADRVAEAAGSLASVEWLGARPTAEVHQLMGEATMLIFPSEWYETFGVVAIEAYAKGTPVIATNIGAVAEIVEHGKTGLLFPPGNSRELADLVNWASTYGRPQLQAMGQQARRAYDEHYTADRAYQELMLAYTSAGVRA